MTTRETSQMLHAINNNDHSDKTCKLAKTIGSYLFILQSRTTPNRIHSCRNTAFIYLIEFDNEQITFCFIDCVNDVQYIIHYVPYITMIYHFTLFYHINT